jgi:hypothetical protein
MLRSLLGHIWPKDRPAFQARVVIAIMLLAGAKVSEYNFW